MKKNSAENSTVKANPDDLKGIILQKISKKNGFINLHSHLDRAYTFSRQNFFLAHSKLQDKWGLVDEIKRKSSEEEYEMRIEKAINTMIKQGVKYCVSFIDVDSITELRALKAAVKVKKKYASQCQLFLVNQVLKGVLDKTERKWAEKSLEDVDFIGGLPSKDRPHPDKHLDILFSWAKQTNKIVHVHVDQENNPEEHEIDLLIKKTMQYGLEGKVMAVHAVSLAAQPSKTRQEIYKKIKASGMGIICCPSAAISMKPLDFKCLIHNSIAPVAELLEAGVTVGLGTDNINDIYQPLVDGDLYTELRFLAEACRYYDIDELVNIASINGRKILGLEN